MPLLHTDPLMQMVKASYAQTHARKHHALWDAVTNAGIVTGARVCAQGTRVAVCVCVRLCVCVSHFWPEYTLET